MEHLHSQKGRHGREEQQAQEGLLHEAVLQAVQGKSAQGLTEQIQHAHSLPARAEPGQTQPSALLKAPHWGQRGWFPVHCSG